MATTKTATKKKATKPKAEAAVQAQPLKPRTLRHLVGMVTSDKMDKTIVVEISTLTRHAKYGKYFKKYKKIKAHDEKSECGTGDRVEIVECRPLSKEKRFRLCKLIEKAKRVDHDEAAVG